MDCGKPMTKPTARKAAGASAGEGGGGGRGSGGGRGGGGGVETANGAAPLPSTRVVARAGPARDQEPIACPFCSGSASKLRPFCPHCGRRLTAPGSGPNCPRCASPVDPGIKFCATCGAPLIDVAAARRGISGPSRAGATIALVQLDDLGSPVQRFERTTPDTTIGRMDGDIRFPDDVFLSPLHAKLSWEQDTLVVRDLGSRNGTWVFLEEAHRLLDGDLLLIGSQVIRFRRLGYPGPHPPDADATKRMGSLSPSADIASLTQLRSDGSVRDVIQLSPGRDVAIGREQGDWVFPYDPAMSARHALVRSEDADFVVVDANSRNGVAIAARGDMALRDQSRILVGDKLLRIEIPT